MKIYIDFPLSLKEKQTHPENCDHNNVEYCCIIFEPECTMGIKNSDKNVIRIMKSLHMNKKVKICKDCYSLFFNDKFVPGAILSIIRQNAR